MTERNKAIFDKYKNSLRLAKRVGSISVMLASTASQLGVIEKDCSFEYEGMKVQGRPDQVVCRDLYFQMWFIDIGNLKEQYILSPNQTTDERFPWCDYFPSRKNKVAVFQTSEDAPFEMDTIYGVTNVYKNDYVVCDTNDHSRIWIVRCSEIGAGYQFV